MNRLRTLLLAVCLAVGGCAAIPSSGPVTEVVDDTGFGQSTVRYSPALPTDGALPGEVVRGYLDAMLAYPSSTRTATAFLTPSAARRWNRQSGVTVYGDAQVAVPPEDGRTRSDAGSTAVVTVDSAASGHLDAQGRYEQRRGRFGVEYRLEQVKGEWRITNPQPGLMVTEKFFDDYFRPFNLYFFDRPAGRLVAQPIHLLVEDGLAAALITALARGDESAQTRTFVPRLDDLRATVPVSDAVADVGFTAGSRSASDVERLSAQVVWTLRQAPDVDGVRISVGTGAVQPRGAAVQPVTGWAEYGLAGDADAVHGLVDDQVVEVDGTDVSPISGPWGKGADGASAVAVTDERIALVAGDRETVRVATLDGDVQRSLDGTGLIDPASDVDGRFWLVDRPGGDTRVRVVGEDVATLDASALSGLRVRSIDISPDGARYAVTVGSGAGSSVQVGRVVRDAEGVATGLGTPSTVSGAAEEVRSAVWADAARVSFLADTESGIQVRTALIDGSAITGSTAGSLLPEVDTTRLVVGEGDTTSYATDARGRLWHVGSRGTWLQVDTERIDSLVRSR
jgi:hypothetical protein